jgi:hypothetical protein
MPIPQPRLSVAGDSFHFHTMPACCAAACWQSKNQKYGFGGRKRLQKQNDASSAADMSGFKWVPSRAGPGRAAQPAAALNRAAQPTVAMPLRATSSMGGGCLAGACWCTAASCRQLAWVQAWYV